MKRLDLPELEDSPRMPRWLRDAMTGYLGVVIDMGRPYAAAAPALAQLVRDSGSSRIIDLGSGGGGPWPHLVEDLERELGSRPAVLLTDLQPNLTAAAALERIPRVDYRREPLSALAVPTDIDGVRTMFTGLHHFDPGEVQDIFSAAQDARAPFLAAEATHRSVRGVLVTLLVPLFVLFLMPRVRPRRFLPLLLTYLPPLLPVLIWWDGVASTLKTHRAAELRGIAARIRQPGYDWSIDEVRVRGAPIPVTLVVGRPTEPHRNGPLP